MFGMIFQHFGRYQEIVSVLIRHGFGFILFESMGLKSQGKTDIVMARLGQRIRLVLSELGPTFIKLGQFASTRPDIIPMPIIYELEQLQDRVRQVPFAVMRRTVEQELGASLEDLFQEFDPSPLASASIGQVHFARLKTGESVAVKVQRPNLEIIRTDLEILKEIIPLIENRFPKLKSYSLRGILGEFSRWLEAEQDYLAEGKNAETIAKGFARDSQVIFPRIFWTHTTRRVLTMSYLEGIKLNEREKILTLYDGRTIAELLGGALLRQILRDGFFHGDPHPGNIIVLSKEKIGLIDFGIVGVLNQRLKRKLLKVILALKRRDSKAMAESLLRLGISPKKVDFGGLCQDLTEICRSHLDVPFCQVDLRKVINDCMNLAFRYEIQFPPEFVLLGKSLLTLEGIIHKLDPSMSLAELIKPFRSYWFLEHWSIKEWFKSFLSKKVLNHDPG
ncbi:putative unusual protein kinase [Desulfosporosinus acidiphilus SJ4]|uniref:Putative unusual protein kinase n=2 Tax=Desulfosporosinus TaxID=79206 RepID=I4D322_DESAJ|nr:putative unusual protein kinase [Desulfosporosinus acidiphilus SJ4]